MKAVVTRVRSASVTINGTLNGKIENGFLVLLGVGPEDSEQDAVVAEALKDPKVQKFTEGMDIIKVILVKNKLVNLIVKPKK